MSVSVEHWQDVSSVHEESWERQCRLFLPAVRVLPSDQQRTGGVVPAEPFVLEGPEVGQPRGGTLWFFATTAAASSMAWEIQSSLCSPCRIEESTSSNSVDRT